MANPSFPPLFPRSPLHAQSLLEAVADMKSLERLSLGGCLPPAEVGGPRTLESTRLMVPLRVHPACVWYRDTRTASLLALPP